MINRIQRAEQAINKMKINLEIKDNLLIFASETYKGIGIWKLFSLFSR